MGNTAEHSNLPLNGEVLRLLFHNYCSIDDLKTVRLVCRQWWQASSEFWKDSSCIQICDCKYFCRRPLPPPPDMNRAGRYNYEEEGPMQPCREKVSLNNFMEMVRGKGSQLLELPFRHFKLRGLEFRTPIESTDVQDFWRLFGAKIYHIDLALCTAMENRSVPNEFYRRIPNVESLTIGSFYWTNQWSYNYPRGLPPAPPHTAPCPNLQTLKLVNFGYVTVTDLTRIFDHCVNLRELLVSGKWDRLGRNHRRPYLFSNMLCLLEAIQAVRSREGPQRIFGVTSLDIMDTVELAIRETKGNPNRHLHNLVLTFGEFAIAALPLQRLSIDLGERILAHQAQSVLSSHASTLETLTLFRVPKARPFWSFGIGTQMPEMKELQIYGSVIMNLGFLKFMPNLRKFKLQISAYDKKEKLAEILKERFIDNVDQCIVENTKKLWKRQIDTTEDGSPVGKNLEEFEVDYLFGKKSVRALSRWLPNLKTLSVIADADTVKVIGSRWPQLECLRLLYGSRLTDEDVVNYLVKLEKLEELYLTTICDESKLTNSSVLDGFLKMPALRKIDICVSSLMCEEAERVLKENIQVVVVHRNYKDHTPHECCTMGAYRREAFKPPATHSLTLRSREVVKLASPLITVFPERLDLSSPEPESDSSEDSDPGF